MKDLSGPVGIVDHHGASRESAATESIGDGIANWSIFCAMIAVNLAVMNLLPIPALDGGRVVFLLSTRYRHGAFHPQKIPSEISNAINGAGFACCWR